MFAAMRLRAALCVVFVYGCAAGGIAAEGKAPMPVKIDHTGDIVTMDNGIVSISINHATTAFTARAGEKKFITAGRLGDKAVRNSTGVTDDKFGKGHVVSLVLPDQSTCQFRVYQGRGLIFFRSDMFNAKKLPVTVNKVTPLSFSAALGKAPAELKTLGCDGLFGADRERTVHAFLAAADPATRAGLVAGWLTHDRASGVVTVKPDAGTLRIEARSEYGRLLIPRSRTVEGETFVMGYFGDTLDGLEAFADAIAIANDVKLPPAPSGYCTWYSNPHGGAADEKRIAELAAFAKKELTKFGFGVIQIDDKWQISGRDFTTHRPGGPYPGGMKPTAAGIRAAGMRAGLWYIPFGWDPKRPVFAEHQDWFVKRAGGKELYTVRWAGTCLDMTHPAARKFLAATVSRISNDWGFKYIKIDGLWTGLAAKITYPSPAYRDEGYGDAVFHDPSKTNLDAYRSGLALVRKAAGKDVYILGCNIAQNMRTLGGSFARVDGMRVGRDISAKWDKIIPCMQMGSRLYFLHGRVWHNDPDCLMLRKPLTLDQARAWGSWIALSGQLNLVSEWLPGLPADRLEVIKRSMPNHGLCGRPVDLMENPNPRIWTLTAHKPVRRDVVGLFNWNAKSPADFSVDTARLALAPSKTGKYVGFDYWADAFVAPFDTTLKATLPGGSCRVIAVRPVEGRPVLVSTSRHITQGVIDVQAETWDAASKTLSGVSTLVAGDPYELRIFVPKLVVATATATAEGKDAMTIKLKQEGPHLRVKFTSATGGKATWKIVFKSAE